MYRGGKMNMKTLITMCLCILLTACASKPKEKTRAERQAELYYNQGTRELVAKDYTLALQKLLEANRLKPNDSKICNNLGMAYYFKKDHETGIRFVKKSIKLDPKNTDAKLNLATIYMQDNKLDKAETLYKSLLKDLTYTKHSRTYYNLAMIELRRNNDTKAVEYLDKSVEDNPNYCPSYYKLGDIASKRGSYKKALKFYKSSGMGICYDNIKPHLAQIEMMIKLKDYDQARLKLDEMMEKYAMTKHESIVKLKIEEVNRMRRLSERTNQEYSKKLDRNFLSTDF